VSEPILVAHSAAGLLLPSLADALGASALIFVDARLPPALGRVRPVDDEFMAFLRTLPTEGGRLPPWSRWWGDRRLESLIRDPARRSQFEADLPRLPLSWFDAETDVPPWASSRCAYLRLSKPYEPEALTAERRGWTVVHIDGTHLHPMIEPEATADAVIALAKTVSPTALHSRTAPESI
jgi:hypothetical protein